LIGEDQISTGGDSRSRNSMFFKNDSKNQIKEACGCSYTNLNGTWAEKRRGKNLPAKGPGKGKKGPKKAGWKPKNSLKSFLKNQARIKTEDNEGTQSKKKKISKSTERSGAERIASSMIKLPCNRGP